SVLIEGMPGEIEAEHFLFAREQLFPRPFRHERSRVARGGGRSGLGSAEALEERGLPLLAVALAPLPCFHGLIEAGEEPGPRPAEGIKSARLNQARTPAAVRT